MANKRPSRLDDPEIVSFFSNKMRYLDWLTSLDQPLSKTVISIPARSSSKRVKDKNIRQLNGLPLLVYSIIMAKQITGVDRVFVNTDSREYADIAVNFGAEVPFLRPKELSGDASSIAESNIFLTRYLMEEDYPVNAIINMYPTSPFRNISMMNQLSRLLKKNACVTTCICVDYAPEKICSKTTEYIAKYEHKTERSSLMCYKTTGAFIGINRNYASKKLDYKLCFHNNAIELIDIDTLEDFKVAETILKENLYDFGIAI